MSDGSTLGSWGAGLCILLMAACSSDRGPKASGASAASSTGGGGSDGTGGDANQGGTNSAGSGGISATTAMGSGGSESGGGSGGSTANGGSAGGSGGNSSATDGAAGQAGAGGDDPDPDGPLTIATGQQAPTGIAVNASHVYFANRDAGTILRCPRAGCGDAAPEVVVSDQDAPIAIAIDGSEIFWVTGWNPGESGAPPSRPVFRCPLDDCDSDAITEFERGTANPYGLALSPDTVYLASWPQLLACPRTGCAGDETSLLTAPAVDSVVAGSTLYTAFLGFGEVSSCELAGCDTLTTVVDDIWPRGVAVDDTAIYATDNAALFSSALEGEPRVVRCPLSGCDADTLTVLADGDVSPYGIAEYDTRVYFTNVDHGTVLSIRKFD